MTSEELDELEDNTYRCEHNYERIMAYGNKWTYGCVYCGATRTVKVKR